LSSAASFSYGSPLWKTFRSKPNAIPVADKTDRFPTGIAFTLGRISPESKEKTVEVTKKFGAQGG
jgi:hypothetical protein